MNPQNAMVGIQGGAVGAPMANSANIDAGNHERLNTYIYDHLCRMKLWDLARSFYQSCPIQISKTKKEMNGDDGMDTDSKDGAQRPEDLPIPSIGHHHSENSFLFDWWCQFWDVYAASRKSGSDIARQYYTHNMQQAKMRTLSQQNMMGMNANMMARQQQFPGMQQANGMNNMQKQAIANRNGMQQMMANKMQQNNMQEGDRPQSPGSMGNAPSPSKRPRLDDGQFNGQPNPAGRGQPMPGNQVGQMPGAPNGMMMQNGMPADMNQLNFTQNGQQKMEMAGVAPQGMEGSFDMMNQQRPMANGAANPSQGNHALQDYQMQLMLLEQQNKKRLLMARQEQDNISHVPGSSQPGPIQFAGQPAGMSPQNGRPGPSPNPNDQMKRMQTPKMGPGNMPGSPAMNDANRGSPMPGNFDQNNIPPQMRQQIFAQQSMMQGQPPSSHPNFQTMQLGNVPPNMNMEQQMRMAAQQSRLPNGAPFPQGGQPMMQQNSQQGMVGTPQHRPGAMPPPPAPNTEQQRTQPSSPAQGANGPPTPSQAPKAAPKGKKETAKKSAPQKGAAAKKDAATPSANADNAAAATPQPSTPITPMHPASFGNQKPGANVTAGGPANAQSQPAQQQAPNTGGLDVDAFGVDFSNPELTFASEGPDVLENFDFDSFLHNTDDTNSFGNFDFMNIGLEETSTS